ncbi:MAG: hypothetical protein JW856_02305 [Dehalococcoidales bacterium]|nr:hypothetical protein [Dehalococcoidales bacterium]
MTQKEQLLKEYDKWSRVSVKAYEQIGNLINSITAPPLIEKFVDVASRIGTLERQMDEAREKMLVIQVKLSQTNN